MKKIIISNRKGGSGKSTTAVNLASELAKESTVLLIDFDTQGHASMGVGVKISENVGAHGIFNGKTLSECFMPTALEKLTLAPAQEFFDVYEYSDIRGVLKNRIKKEKLEDFFDYCIIDTPPTYDAILKNSLEVADCVVIPVIPHHLGTIGVDQMFRAIYQISTACNKKMPYIGILPVMYNPHIQEHKDNIEEVTQYFGKEKLFSPIGIDIYLAAQFKEKIPVVLSDKRRKGARDYINFTKDLKKALKIG